MKRFSMNRNGISIVIPADDFNIGSDMSGRGQWVEFRRKVKKSGYGNRIISAYSLPEGVPWDVIELNDEEEISLAS